MITLPHNPSESFPQALYISGSSVEVCTEPWEMIESDPRGLVLMWEPVMPGAQYIAGVDASEGITGWSRATRIDGDDKTDNGVVEIFRVDGDFDLLFKTVNGVKIPDIDPKTKRQRRQYKDVQVAEFAAPCDAVEIARVANVLGRIYSGGEDDACQLIWEAWPGAGLLTTQELIRLGYPNLWMWEYIDREAQETNSPGWRSTSTSQRLLWYRARRHLMKRSTVIRSKWLLEEYSNAEIDLTKMRARAAYGYHDDRMMAANLCFWAGHRWSYMQPVEDQVTTTPEPIDFQRFAPVLGDDNSSYKDWRNSMVLELEE
jgi:hypothetical protein